MEMHERITATEEATMDCEQAHRKLHPWLDGELPPDEARRMAKHMRNCAVCAAEARRLSALFDSLGALPVLPPAPDLARATLRAAFENPAPPTQWWLGLSPLHKGASFAAMAAGILLGIFLFTASGIPQNQQPNTAITSTGSAFLLSVSEVDYL